MKLLFLFTILFTSTLSYADRVVKVNSVNAEDGVFTVRNDQNFKVFENMRAFFTSETISIKAKLVGVNEEYLTWQVENENIAVPFSEEDFLILEPYENIVARQKRIYSKEYIDKIKKLSLKLDEQIKTKKYHGFSFKTFLNSELTSTYNLFNDDEIEKVFAMGLQGEYLFPLSANLFFAPGLRFNFTDKNINGTNYKGSQTIFMAQFYLHLSPLVSFKRSIPYFSFGLGAGISQTQFPQFTTDGHVIVLPALAMGLLVPVEGALSGISIELSIDAVSIREGHESVTNDYNAAQIGAGLGYLHFF
ncbi:MAG: hypothetical protein H6621_08900 [Halobacteriovoraceae bacterium]|nr:hypothetical protein [Halobacteriovoraceae bacterium]MCB9095171.1 hypothetical protein [Halobacteriovoraceae bacterium]